jgi:acetyl esterase/lipase
MDRNVWTPELAWFTKHGYAVASLDYSVTARTRFPEQICDIKEGIRFLRSHSEQFGLDPGRFAIMGESAGGYFSALAGVTGNTKEYDTGANLDESSAVQAVVAWYPISEPSTYEVEEKFALMLPRDMKNYADVTQKTHAAAPPTLILHGNADVMVDISQGEKLHDSLEAAGAEVDMIILDGARHLDAPFVQLEIKRSILDFLDKRLKDDPI